VVRRLVDVTLDNLREAPAEVLGAVFWELDVNGSAVDPEFEKEEWFSSTLLEWGTCGKMALDENRGSVGFAEYAPATFFPRLTSYRAGTVSRDAIYLAYCYVVATRRGFGLGTELVRALARDLVDRGYVAVEAIGDRAWDGGWVLPSAFLGANGFRVIREDHRFPLMRLDLLAATTPREVADTAAVPLPAPGVV
jgi:GNAT superfamily N-acetyltransferase